MITDGHVNYKEAFTDLLVNSFALSIDAWTDEDLILLRTYIGRELSARTEAHNGAIAD